jgi:hypothetical protein
MTLIVDESNSDSIVRSVIQSFLQRSKIGKEKYNTTLDREDLSLLEWIQHCQEEYMDSILYLEKIKKVLNDTEIPDSTIEDKMAHLLTTKMKNILSSDENHYCCVMEEEWAIKNTIPKLFYYLRDFVKAYQVDI